MLQWLENMVAKNFVDRQVMSGVSRYELTEIGKTGESYSLSCAGHVLRRLDLSYLTHHRPVVKGNIYYYELVK